MADSPLLAELEKNNLQALWSDVARTLGDQPGSCEMLKVLGASERGAGLTLDRSTEVASSGPTANDRLV